MKVTIRLNKNTYGKDSITVQEMANYEYLEKVSCLTREESIGYIEMLKRKYTDNCYIEFNY